MIADRIKLLRENNKLSQETLAKKLGITRSSVNAWEMGLSVPSTQYIVEMSSIFKVSADYILCIQETANISISGLTAEDVSVVYTIIDHLRSKNIETNKQTP